MTISQDQELPKLFPYQEYQVGQIIKRCKTGVISPPGSGKTRVPIEALRRLGLVRSGYGVEACGGFTAGPILVVCTGPAIGTWKWQFPYWMDEPRLKDHIHVVRGKPKERAALWNQAYTTREGIYITNSQLFWRDFDWIMQKRGYKDKPGSHWAALIADEYHKYMRRRKSATFKQFAMIARNIAIVVPLTGSVIGNDPSSMWTLFHVCNPELPMFRSFWRFTHKFCIVNDDGYGKQIEGVRNVTELKELMNKYLAYVPREVVADQLPGGNRRRLPVEMTPSQERAYHKIKNEMILELQDGSLVVAPTVLSKFTLLRKLLCIPKMVDPNLDWGGGFEAIVERLEEQPHCVIFVPFRDACDWVQQGLQDKGYSDVYILRGQITAEQQSMSIQLFKEKKGIIICTIAYAESFDLETCDTSYFLGYSHLDQNQQAEGRTQRAISKFESVWWHYIVHLDTYDEDLLDRLNETHATTRKVLERPTELLQLLKGS